jgi:hypothetical protein
MGFRRNGLGMVMSEILGTQDSRAYRNTYVGHSVHKASAPFSAAHAAKDQDFVRSSFILHLKTGDAINSDLIYVIIHLDRNPDFFPSSRHAFWRSAGTGGSCGPL